MSFTFVIVKIAIFAVFPVVAIHDMNIEITRTQDGSNTLYLADIDEHYHSTFGAIQESMHVFIRSGFDFCSKSEISILEIGLGTGLNCFLTRIAGRDSGKAVRYFAVEKFPLPTGILENLNYGENFTPADADFFSAIHACSWNCNVQIDSRFMLHKMEADLLDLKFRDLQLFDLIYFDAFSPEKQPEMWNLTIFEALYLKMSDNGILVTYCAKGAVRRNLQAAGFSVERIPGPPGKREIIRATKTLR